MLQQISPSRGKAQNIFSGVFVFLLMLAVSPRVEAWNAEVLHTSDGDTVVVRRIDTQEKVRIRLYGIDAPEGPGSKWQAQPYSRKATNFAKQLLPKGSQVAVIDMGYDKYNRTVGGIISLPDGRIIQEEMLRAGYAWVYPQYCKNCGQWSAIQEEAQKNKVGLWQDPQAVPPWEWRKKR